MASQKEAVLIIVLFIICLDVSSVVATAVMWNPKTSRYVDNYNLDKGPVFYETYYPKVRSHGTQEERYFDQNMVVETSFQVPLEHLKHLAYLAETSNPTDHSVSINESFLPNNEDTLSTEQPSRRNYDSIISQSALFAKKPSTVSNDDRNTQITNIEEISKLVKRAISRDLENWNTLAQYLDRTIHQTRPIVQHPSMSSINRTPKDTEQSFISNISSDKLNAEKQRSVYFEGIDANENTMAREFKISGKQIVDPLSRIDPIPDSLITDNIFQPRPQLIKYTFFKRQIPSRLDKKNDKVTNEFTSQIHDKFINEEIANKNRDKRKEDVKVTSIEISESPRHKTRHHHGEWLKRNYFNHGPSQPINYPSVS